MVASHAWDIMGAAHAGLRTAWISAFEKEYPPIWPAPDVVASDLESAARAIIGREDRA